MMIGRSLGCAFLFLLADCPAFADFLVDGSHLGVFAALRSSFAADPNAPEEQHGTITYTFVINQ